MDRTASAPSAAGEIRSWRRDRRMPESPASPCRPRRPVPPEDQPWRRVVGLRASAPREAGLLDGRGVPAPTTPGRGAHDDQ